MTTLTRPDSPSSPIEGLKTPYWAIERKLRRLAWRLNAKAHFARRPGDLAGQSQDYRRFLVLAHARSGSNLLVDGLATDPRILSYAEIFHRTEVFIDPLVATEPLRFLRREMPLRFLQEAIYGAVHRRIQAVGFKVFPEHLDASLKMQQVRGWLAAQNDISVINLSRRNLLRYYVSFKKAWRSGQWQLPVGSFLAGSQSFTLHVDPADAERVFKLREERDSAHRALFSAHPMLTLYYEDLQAELLPTFARVQNFLGMEACTVQLRQLKQETRSLPEIIENYDELRRRWSGSRWESFLEE